MPDWTGSWDGGRTYQTRDERTVWVIRKMVKGHRYGIGKLGLTFWNWPPLSASFVREVTELLGHRSVLVRGKL